MTTEPSPADPVAEDPETAPVSTTDAVATLTEAAEPARTPRSVSAPWAADTLTEDPAVTAIWWTEPDAVLVPEDVPVTG